MDRNTIRHALMTIVEAETGQDVKNVGEDAEFESHFGLDSVDRVSLIMQVERRFRIRMTHDELVPIVKVGDLLDLIEQKTLGAEIHVVEADVPTAK